MSLSRSHLAMTKRKTDTKQVILIDKSSTVKEIQVSADLNDLYKKAGFKTTEGFQEQFVWEVIWEEQKYTVSLYAKKTGRIPKNTYGFPPPLEDTVFYGNCILVCAEMDLPVKTWDNLFEVIYEKYDDDEGMEDDDDVNDEDEDEEEALEEEEEDEEEEIDEEDDEAKQVGSKKKKYNKPSRKKEETFILLDPPVVEQYLDCSSELELEPYV